MVINRKEQGQGLVEYALILVGVVVVVLLILNLMGISVRDVYCQAASSLGSTTCEDRGDCSFTFDSVSDLDTWEGDAQDSIGIEDGKACVSGDGKNANSYLNSKCSQSLASNDYSISLSGVTVDRLIDNNKNTGFDTWFRVQDAQNGYLFIYNSHTNYVRFWKIVDNKWVRLAQARAPKSWLGQELNFRIDVQGESFKAYQGGELILEATDSAYTDGEIGVRNKPSSKSCVDDISVEPITD